MTTREERKRRLRELARLSKEKTDEELTEALQALKEATRTDLESLRPRVASREQYEGLVAAIEEATARNESIAELRARLEKLGPTALQLAREVQRLLGKG